MQFVVGNFSDGEYQCNCTQAAMDLGVLISVLLEMNKFFIECITMSSF